MKKRILFVDDDSNLLDNLRRTLRSQRDCWEMVFLSDGQEALQRMRQQPFDAVVTDMQMPGMDGAELLDWIKESHPQTIRIVLSAPTDSEMTLRAVGTAHQYLSKPCDPNHLCSILTRAFLQQQSLENVHLRELITGMDSLPTLPTLFVKINQLLHSEQASMDEIGQVIGQDPAMTAKILQLVNSAFFGVGKTINSASDAVKLLGIDTVQSLVLSIGIFSQYHPAPLRAIGLSLEALWRHSQTVGLMAMCIVTQENASSVVCEESFLGGMLHDLGILILAKNHPQEYAQVVTRAGQEESGIHTIEQTLFGANHAEVGAYLLSLWGFSDTIVEAVALHHDPDRSPNDQLTPLTAVHVANALHLSPFRGDATSHHPLDMRYLRRIGFHDRTAQWEGVCLDQQHA